MAGQLIRSLLVNREYPWCLDETFSLARKPSDQSYCSTPYSGYASIKDLNVVAWMVLAIAGVFPTLGLGAWMLGLVSNKGDGPLPVLFVFGCVGILSWLLLMALTRTRSPGAMIDYASFEQRLHEIILMFNSDIGLLRLMNGVAIHQMRVDEARKAATEYLSHIAACIISIENASGRGNEHSQRLHRLLREDFDLCAHYGLVDTKLEYKPLFERAEKLLQTNPHASFLHQVLGIADRRFN